MEIIAFVIFAFWFFNLIMTLMFLEPHPAGRFWFYNWNRNWTLIITHVSSIFFTITIPIAVFIYSHYCK